jgi:hypothetical protein
MIQTENIDSFYFFFFFKKMSELKKRLYSSVLMLSCVIALLYFNQIDLLLTAVEAKVFHVSVT